MSTQINVTVDSGGLAERARQQQQAARAAQLEKERLANVEAQATTEQEAASTANGTTPSGESLYGVQNKKPTRKDEPAANSPSSILVVNGVVLKYSNYRQLDYQVDGTNGWDFSIRIEIGLFGQSTPAVFEYKKDPITFGTGAPPEPLPDTYPEAPNVYTQAAYAALPQSASTSWDADAQTYVDKSFYFLVPRANGGVYVVVHTNQALYYEYGIGTRTISTQLTTETESIGFRQPSGQRVAHWSFNNFPDSFIGRAVSADYVPRIFVSNSVQTDTRTASPSPITTTKVNEVHCFDVSPNGTVTEIQSPSGLLSILNNYRQPADFNSTSTYTTAQTSVLTLWWLGAVDGNGNPGGGDASTAGGSSAASSYPAYDPALDPYGFGREQLYIIDYEAGTYYPYIDTRLLRYTGGFPMGPTPQTQRFAWGPGFALALPKAPMSISYEDSLDYDYMTTNVIGKKPKKHISACVLPGSCPSSTVVGWNYTTSHVTKVGDSLSADNFTANAAYVLTTPAYAAAPGSGYAVEYYTNWADAEACRQACNGLGFPS